MSVVELSHQGQCAVLKLNRPETLNAINNAMLSELEMHLDVLEHAECRAIVITGEGRGFCAGTDLKEWHGDPTERMRRVHALVLRLLHYPKTSIAAINGLALGGGLELALACTFRVARASARLGLPEVKLGLLPAYAGTQLLPRLIGANRALEVMLGGEPVDGTRAAEIGLANRVVPDEADVVSAACEFAGVFTRHSLVPQRAIRRAVLEGIQLPLEEAMALELRLVAEVSASADTQEGVNAFLEKRAPVWKDC